MLDLWRRVVIGSAIAVYVAGVACAGGVLLNGMRLDERLSGALRTSVEMTLPWRWASLPPRAQGALDRTADAAPAVAAGEAGR
jgi:hypothetical protein